MNEVIKHEVSELNYSEQREGYFCDLLIERQELLFCQVMSKPPPQEIRGKNKGLFRIMQLCKAELPLPVCKSENIFYFCFQE